MEFLRCLIRPVQEQQTLLKWLKIMMALEKLTSFRITQMLKFITSLMISLPSSFKTWSFDGTKFQPSLNYSLQCKIRFYFNGKLFICNLWDLHTERTCLKWQVFYGFYFSYCRKWRHHELHIEWSKSCVTVWIKHQIRTVHLKFGSWKNFYN